MKRGAVIDPMGIYRYSLWREWDTNAHRLAFIMLNPSLADEITDDPTLRRCISFAQSWGYGSLEVVNLFGYRASRPTILKQITDPIGPENDRYLKQAVDLADKIVLAWGNQGILKNRAKVVLHWLDGFESLYCLGITQTGNPRHPLYVKGNTKPVYYLP